MSQAESNKLGHFGRVIGEENNAYHSWLGLATGDFGKSQFADLDNLPEPTYWFRTRIARSRRAKIPENDIERSGGTPDEVQQLADVIALAEDCDVILFNGSINKFAAKELVQKCDARRRRKNVLLLLITLGGDAGAAYQIARNLQSNYEKFVLFVSGYCKSAGTLVATGAHELVIANHGELGPLDVQLSKKDELWELQSGLTVTDTLNSLQERALITFERFFLTIKARSGGTITLNTATDIATAMTTGLFSQLYSQVDPLHVGEATRAMRIAGDYGNRLLERGRNISLERLQFLMTNYPTHDFVIDREEASILFRRVREPKETESELASALGDHALVSETLEHVSVLPFRFLSSQPPDPEEHPNPNDQLVENGETDEELGRVERPGIERATAQAGAVPSQNAD